MMSRIVLDLPTLALLVVLSAMAPAAEPSSPGTSSPKSPPLAQQLSPLVEQLDSDQYRVRQNASQQLEQFATRKELAIQLATELRAILVRADLSLEARRRLESLARRLPTVLPQPAQDVSVEEVDRLVAQLESDSYSRRSGAAQRLVWLLGGSRLVSPIMVRLKQRVLADDLSADARQWLEPIAEQARAAWLASDPKTWDLPAVADEQIAQWVDDVASPRIQENAQVRTAHRAALRELHDLLARDGEVPRVKAALARKLDQAGIDKDGARRLTELLDLTRPAMVAEFWSEHQQRGTQHLLVGVPSWGQLAERPSHFDRIDDQTAHCASGQNLSPGDYPVGVAIPHPNPRLDGRAFFHLVNLPTPRRRMAYAYQQDRDSSQRLAEISRRTLERFLQRKALLSEAELVMLPQLDPDGMSAFASKMLLSTDDQPLAAQGAERIGGRPSHHGLLCAALAEEGRGAATAGLLEAIRTGRVLPPTPEAPYHLDWLAALAIAARDPSSQLDTWLVSVVPRNDPLVLQRTPSPELGASAAAVLVERHQQNPSAFGLAPIDERTMEILKIHGYRFTASDGPAAFAQWWTRQKQQPTVDPNVTP